MSDQIDWSKAPADATHANGAGVFFRESRRGPLAAFDNGSWVITRSTIADFNPEYIFERPSAPSWSGEGLPPVGVDIEVMHELYVWIGARVVGQDGDAAIVRTNDGYAGVFPHQMRPIITPEQIAADEREAAINEIEDLIAGYSYRHCAELIHDNGYRKP